MIDAPREEKFVVKGDHIFKVRSEGEFECLGSTFLYSGGFRWGVKYEGNGLKILEQSKSCDCSVW